MLFSKQATLNRFPPSEAPTTEYLKILWQKEKLLIGRRRDPPYFCLEVFKEKYSKETFFYYFCNNKKNGSRIISMAHFVKCLPLFLELFSAYIRNLAHLLQTPLENIVGKLKCHNCVTKKVLLHSDHSSYVGMR